MTTRWLPALCTRPALRSARAFLTRTCLAALAMTASACEDPSGPATGIFVSQAGDVLLAVVAADDLVTVFACDGSYDWLGVRAWFYGALDDGSGTLTNADGATVDLEIHGDQFSAALRGELVTNGPYDFTGTAVAGADAGLYWGQVDGWIGGWILDEAGEQRGAAIKRSTDDASLVYIEPAQTEVVLDDGTVLPLTRMTAPTKVE
ncbi:hypothetical protein OV090_39795 [Nannocystis sp. RBIL2]|uniref:hypothetical protein n=1 Tax=Nannocystis sp. RBIL2 TaxID=2996788 RepID=UPI002271FBBF|nr:hypothetical protein [Nannocystis sp. RBIL2]MCY1070952.1 hypothetical protein [Nannocystis sp. RBIL2]